MGIFGKTHQFTNIKNPQKFFAALSRIFILNFKIFLKKVRRTFIFSLILNF